VLARRIRQTTLRQKQNTLTDDLPEPLKLIALDADDVTILSAHLQDAIVRVGDLVWRPGERRFALLARRFDWDAVPEGAARRRLTALHFDRVSAVKATKIDPANTDAPRNLLAITFAVTETPAGDVTLMFSEGAAIKLTVECIEAQMKDLGPVWAASTTPDHKLDDT
jgi:Protein of unknown function (DUF2948)